MQQFRRIFWTGLAARLLSVPFLLQWFHADERQMLEFAHFHAHGRLHPFLESQLHLRNQTLPWLFSGVIRFCDQLGLSSPWFYLIAIQSLIAVWTWFGFWALLNYLKEKQSPRIAIMGWFFALFWGFSILYSRPLLEAVSFAPACFLLLAVQRKQPIRAGFWAGLAGIFRYPSLLWTIGAGTLWLWEARVSRFRGWFQSLCLGLLGWGMAILLGGLADGMTYGKFLESLPAYWTFNQPGGPVGQMFGDDSLLVYLKWFSFLFTPWLAPIFILVSLWALFRVPSIGIFCLPYVIGHFWTPHREPRFMLPLTPFLTLAIVLLWDQCESRGFHWLQKRGVVRVVKAGIAAHLILNFLWFPLNFRAQWKSAQGVLLRHYSVMASQVRELVTLSDPLIDVWVPPMVKWGDSQCQWHRPDAIREPFNTNLFWVLSRGEMGGCKNIEGDSPLPVETTLSERIFRVRYAQIWACDREKIEQRCPNGWVSAPPGEPIMGKNALRKDKNDT